MKPQAIDDDAKTTEFQVRDRALAQAQAEARRARDWRFSRPRAAGRGGAQRPTGGRLGARPPGPSLALAFARGVLAGIPGSEADAATRRTIMDVNSVSHRSKNGPMS